MHRLSCERSGELVEVPITISWALWHVNAPPELCMDEWPWQYQECYGMWMNPLTSARPSAYVEVLMGLSWVLWHVNSPPDLCMVGWPWHNQGHYGMWMHPLSCAWSGENLEVPMALSRALWHVGASPSCQVLCTTPIPWVSMMVLFGVPRMHPSSYNTLYGV